MSDYYTFLTNAGLAAVTNAALAGADVEVTHIAVGDGQALPLQTQTTLQNETWRGVITRLSPANNNAAVLECETRIPPDIGGWTVREIGLFNAEGVLLAVGNVPASDKPVLESGSGKDMQIRMYILSSNAEDVTIKIDPAIIMASQSFVLELIAQQSVNSASAMMVALTEQMHRINAQ